MAVVMVDWVRRVVMAGLLAGCASRPPEPAPQVCADPGVLHQVGDVLRARGRELVLEAPPVGEASTGVAASSPPLGPPLAHCAVRGHTVAYDTNRYGAAPVYEPFIARYSVESRHNGMFVRLE